MIPEIIQIKDEAGIERYGPGFVKVYKEAFAGAPYFEAFEESEVNEIMRELVFCEGGACFAMTLNGEIIGLSGGYALSNVPEIVKIFKDLFPKISPENVFYFAELAVDEKWRNRGYGSMLVDARIAFMNGSFKAGLQRTQAEGSNSLNLYLERGFKQVEDMIQHVETHIIEAGERKKVHQERIFTIKFT